METPERRLADRLVALHAEIPADEQRLLAATLARAGDHEVSGYMDPAQVQAAIPTQSSRPHSSTMQFLRAVRPEDLFAVSSNFFSALR